MSNMTIFSSGNLPSYLKNIELDATTKNLAGSGGGGGSGNRRISIKGGVFRMMVNGEELMVNEERSMNVVIVASSPLGRTFYEGAYDSEAAPKAPSCWSPDNTKPAADVKTPQANTCMSCPQNIKGSGQGEARACRFNQRIAVVLEGDLSGDVYQLSLPATSIFGKGVDGQKLPMQAYVQTIAALKLPIGAVVTEMRFDTASATPKLIFRGIRPLEESEYVISKEQGLSDDATRAITMTVSQTDGVKAAEFAPTTPAPVAIEPPKPKAKPAPAPVPEIYDEPAIDEPVKVSKEDAPAPKADLLNLIDEWDQ
jgi:hypothetical protein